MPLCIDERGIVFHNREQREGGGGHLSVKVFSCGKGLSLLLHPSPSGLFVFLAQEPRITDFEPKLGPVSGGTRITIRGRHMDAGTTITASIVGLPCNVTR